MVSECLLWQGATDRDGYGRQYNPRTGLWDMQHRVAWENVNGIIPSDMTIDHLCRVRLCHNVDHMELVSRSTNAARKGHLSDSDISTIRAKYATGSSQGELAKQFHVGQGHISQIVNRRLRKEVI